MTAKAHVGINAKTRSSAALSVTGNGDSHPIAEKLLRQL
jgi:hypothetical protein